MVHLQMFQVLALLEALKHDSKIALEWFHQHFMDANPSKFQFVLMKSFNGNELY